MEKSKPSQSSGTSPQTQNSQTNQQPATNKGIASIQSKTAENQSAAQPNQNKGIEAFQMDSQVAAVRGREDEW